MAVLVLILFELFSLRFNHFASLFEGGQCSFELFIESDLTFSFGFGLNFLLLLSVILLVIAVVDFLSHLLGSLVRWNEGLDLETSCSLSNFFSLLGLSEILRVRNIVNFAEQNCVRSDEGSMQGVFRDNRLNRMGRAFGQFPERFSVLGLGIKRIGIQQLEDVVSEVLVEDVGSNSHSLFEIGGPCFNNFKAVLQHLDVGRSWSVAFIDFKQFGKCFGGEGELFAEDIASPLNAMQSLFREHLQSAMRDLSIRIVRILLAAIGLSLVGNDDLNVAL